MHSSMDGNESTGDSDDEDQLASLSHLYRNQLSAEATVSIVKRSPSSANIDDDDDEESEIEIQEPPPKRARTSPPERNLEHRDLVPNIDNNCNPYDNNRREHNSITEIDFLKPFCDEEVCSYIYECSKKYAKQQGKFTFQLDVPTLKVFWPYSCWVAIMTSRDVECIGKDLQLF